MSRYIDAEKMPSGDSWDALDDKEKVAVLSFLIKLPTADVEEVVHSHWIKDAFCATGDPYYTCASCGRFVRILYPNCPWCRAVMDADRTLEVDEAIREVKMLEDVMGGEDG